ncbi:MAG TPA: ATP-binding protein [Archangium sp.]|uniref:ATP-binding protein n=1 Tax=Archangium sp. TaxID=1872627 RepID=UPI002ED9DFCF
MSGQSDGDLTAYDPLSPLFDASGAEQRLGAERDPFRQLAEALPQIVWTARPDGLHDYLNRRWYEYTGMSFEESKGLGWYGAFHPEDMPEAARRWNHSVTTGEPYEVEYRCRRLDGVWRWFLGRAIPVRDAQGHIVRWFGTCTDIDDHKRTADAHGFLAEASVVLAISLDPEETLRNFMRLAVPRLADWCAVDLVGQDETVERVMVTHTNPSKEALAWELARRDPVNLQDAQQGRGYVLRTGQSELLEIIPEATLTSISGDKDRERLMLGLGLRSSLIVPLIVHGRTLGCITLVQADSGRHFSVADMPLIEELARRAALSLDNARLYRESQQATRRAEQARHEAEQARAILERSNQELDQFAYVASHDLKAPLRGIANLSQWIEDDLRDAMTEETREQMRLLRGRVHRMEALINGILDYSRAGRMRARPELVDVGRLLAECVELLAPPPEATLEVAPGMPTLHTERVPLQQVFLNLISNALKHANRPDVHVRVTAREVGTFWEFSVADDGPGIAPEYHARIWGLFQTLLARDELESTGIGLSVVKKSVEVRGGRAWLESTPGQGATFRFTWPTHLPEEGR